MIGNLQERKAFARGYPVFLTIDTPPDILKARCDNLRRMTWGPWEGHQEAGWHRSLLDKTQEPDWNIDCNGTGNARKSTPFGSIQMWRPPSFKCGAPSDTFAKAQVKGGR